MDNYKRGLRRVLALAIAVTTITTAGSGGLMSLAATYNYGSGTGTTRDHLGLGDELIEFVHIDNSADFEEVKEVSFELDILENTTVSYDLILSSATAGNLNAVSRTLFSQTYTSQKAGVSASLGAVDNRIVASEPGGDDPLLGGGDPLPGGDDPLSGGDDPLPGGDPLPEATPQGGAPTVNPEDCEHEFYDEDTLICQTCGTDLGELYSRSRGMAMFAAEEPVVGNYVRTTIKVSDITGAVLKKGEYLCVRVVIKAGDCKFVTKSDGSGTVKSSGEYIDYGGIFTVGTDAAPEPSDVTSLTLSTSSITIDKSVPGTYQIDTTTDPANRTVTPSASSFTGFDLSKISGTNNFTIAPKAGSTGGKAKVTFSANGPAGAKTADCDIYVLDITYDANVSYTDKPIKAVSSIKCGADTLVEGTHYTVTYTNNTKVGTATAVITNMGNDYGTYSFTKTFRINQTSLAGNESWFGSASYTYNSADKTITITGARVDSTTPLVQGADGDFTAVVEGTPTYSGGNVVCDVIVTGVNGYKDSVTLSGISATMASGVGGKIRLADAIEAEIDPSWQGYTYDGTAKVPDVKYYLKGTSTEITGFASNVTVTGVNNVDASDIDSKAKLIITANSGSSYEGTIELEFEISKADISGYYYELNVVDESGNIIGYKKVDGTSTEYRYYHTGSMITPTAILKKTAASPEIPQKVSEKNNYTVDYLSTTDIGIGYIRLTGKGNYKGTKTIPVNIVCDFNKDIIVKVGGTSNQTTYLDNYVSTYTATYTGQPIEPIVYVYKNSVDSDNLMTKGASDGYTVRYEDNINATNDTTKAKIILKETETGKETTVTFNIAPMNFSDSKVKFTLDKTSFIWSGNPVDLSTSAHVKVKIGATDTELVQGDELPADYHLEYGENTANVGQVLVYAVANEGGNYTGSKRFTTSTVQINKLNITSAEIEIPNSIPDQAYTGSPVEPPFDAIKLKMGGVDLPTEYYTYTITNNIGIGTATITYSATADSPLAGTGTATFKIGQRLLRDLQFVMNGTNIAIDDTGRGDAPVEFYYNNTEQRLPSIVINDGARNLQSGTDYKARYYNNKDVTEAAYVEYTAVDGGNYSGSVRIYFKIRALNIWNVMQCRITPNGVKAKDGEGNFYPDITIRPITSGFYNPQDLSVGTDYDILLEPGVDINHATGEAQVRLVGKGNFTGNALYTYKIGEDISDLTISVVSRLESKELVLQNGIYQFNYNGVEDEDQPQVTLSGSGITPSDYTVSARTSASGKIDIYNSYTYSNVIECTIEPTSDAIANGKFYGSRTIKYLIYQTNYHDAEYNNVAVSDAAPIAFTYSGVRPTIDKDKLKVHANRGGLVPDTEYVIDTDDVGANVGTYKARIKPVTTGPAALHGNFTGSLELPVQINAKSIDDVSVTAHVNDSDSVVYTGKAITFASGSMIVMDGATRLNEGVDFKIKEYHNNTAIADMGETTHPYVVIEGMGNYAGTKDVPFSIVSRKLDAATTTVTPAEIVLTYDNTAVTPAELAAKITVKHGNDVLEYQASDVGGVWADGYKITLGGTYDDLIDNGQFTIEGTGCYSETINKTFKYVLDLGDSSIVSVTDDNASPNYYEIGCADSVFKDNLHVMYKHGAGGSTLELPNSMWEINASNCTSAGLKTVYLNAATGAGSLAKGNTRAATSVTMAYGTSNVIGDFVQISDQEYTGNPISIHPSVWVSSDGKLQNTGNIELREDVDYEVVYNTTDHTNAGPVSYTIKGKGDAYKFAYTGNFNIVYNLANLMDPNIPDVIYDGTAQVPTLNSLELNAIVPKTLIKDQDYKVSYENNTAVGTATVLIESTGFTYSKGSKTFTFKIKGYSLRDGVKVFYDGVENKSYPYIGRAINPVITVWHPTLGMLNPDQYEATVTNNVNAGDAIVHIIGKKAFAGSLLDTTFAITPISLDSSNTNIIVNKGNGHYINDVGTDDEKFTVMPSDFSVKYQVTGSQIPLVEGEDYVVEIDTSTGNTKNASLGTAKIKISAVSSATSNYVGSRVESYEIVKTDITSGDYVTVGDTTMEYTGGILTPDIELKNGDYILVKGRDYTVSSKPAEVKDKGTYTLTITGIGGYTGKKTNVTMTVTERSIATRYDPLACTHGLGIEVIYSEDNAYPTSGLKKVEPEVKIIDHYDIVEKAGTTTHVNKVLEKDVDYTVTYSNNTKAASKDAAKNPDGLAPTITITGIGNYKDTITRTFNIGNSLDGASINLASASLEFNNKVQKPTINSVSAASKYGSVPVNSINYTISYYTLDSNGDEVTDPDLIHVGTKYVKLTGKNEYYGFEAVPYEITPRVIASGRTVTIKLYKDEACRTELPKDPVTDEYYANYTGEDIKPFVKVYDDSLQGSLTNQLIDPSDYDVAYSGNRNVNDAAVVTISFKDDYDGTNSQNQTQTFKIKPQVMSDEELKNGKFEFRFINEDGVEVEEYQTKYTGFDIEPKVVVRYINELNGSVTLEEDTDYKITYNNNRNAGDAQVVITSIQGTSFGPGVDEDGNPVGGSMTKNFVIWASLEDAVIYDENKADHDGGTNLPDQFFTGEQIAATVPTLYCGGNAIPNDGKHFIATPVLDGTDPQSKNWATAEFAYMKITESNETDGLKQYYRSGENGAGGMLAFAIVFDEDLLSFTGEKITYDGTVHDIANAVVGPSGQKLPDSYVKVISHENDMNDASVTPSTTDLTHVGKISQTVEVTVGGRTVTKTGVAYEIVPLNLKEEMENHPENIRVDVMNIRYTGSAKKPTVALYYKGHPLTQGVTGDYLVVYDSSTLPTTQAHAIITAIGPNLVTQDEDGNEIKLVENFIVYASKVTGLKVSSSSTGVVTANWNVSNYCDGYIVRVWDGTQIVKTQTMIGPRNNSFNFSGMTPGKEYTVQVNTYVVPKGQADTFYGYNSFDENTNFKLLDPNKPTPDADNTTVAKLIVPSVTEASSSDAGRASIKWNKGNTSVQSYRIYRSETGVDATDFQCIAVIPATSGGFVNSGLTSGKTYYYYIVGTRVVNGQIILTEKSPVAQVTIK